MKNNNISRREFLKKAGAGALALGVAACAPKGKGVEETENDMTSAEEMVYRENKANGDKVSVIGYGCMRWQMKKDENGRDVIDQDSVNELVDYAISHGINYFDSAPVYLQGQSERATALALLRYPRSSYYIATKQSNMRGDTSYSAGVEMYKTSLKNYETDYIDYYLLHNLGGYNAFKTRFLDNGLIDYFLH
ncbi:MAG: aldo/keto reductase, partial [Bacteroidales bacterium]|nr:aldo/keto reductase [Bacteroidales bacterium]